MYVTYNRTPEVLTMHGLTCLRCHEPIGHHNPLLWCIKCRSSQRQRGRARGLMASIKVRRLKAWLKTFPYS